MSKSNYESTNLRMGAAVLAAVVGGLFWSGNPAAAASCTDGVDCYCDTVADPQLLYCEDFEDREFYERTTNNWTKAPSGSPGDRGLDSKWFRKYGVGVQGVTWQSGTPSTPRIGAACSPTGLVCGTKEYCSQNQGNLVDGKGRDCWNGNSSAGVDIQRSNDFRDEMPSLNLTGGTGATSDVGAGNAHLAYRIEPGKTSGIIASIAWNPVTEMGVTMAAAYSSNIAGASILDDPWKHDEFGNYPGSEYFMMGNVGPGSAATNPFRPFMFLKTPYGAAAKASCQTALNNARVLVGSASCSDVMLFYGATAGTGVNQYNQSSDWPFGTWGCTQSHIKGMGTADLELKVWFNGDLIIHIDNFDGRVLYNQYYDELYLNSYANANIGPTPTNQLVYRYQDNMHIRNGPPVSCAAIGFGTGAVSPPPGPSPTPLPAPVLLP